MNKIKINKLKIRLNILFKIYLKKLILINKVIKVFIAHKFTIKNKAKIRINLKMLIC